jgi:hypothetical protein
MTLSPGSSGDMTDPDGRTWTVRRRRLDSRTVRSMIKRADCPILLGQAGGGTLRWIDRNERPRLADLIRTCYALPRNSTRHAVEYIGHEFADAEDRRLLCIEEEC